MSDWSGMDMDGRVGVLSVSVAQVVLLTKRLPFEVMVVTGVHS